jgi:hypothetical protein
MELFSIALSAQTKTTSSQWLKEAGFVHPPLLDVPAVSLPVLATKPEGG